MMDDKECKTQCVNCDHSFASDLYDGEVSCRKSGEWFENWAYPFNHETEGECPDYEE